MRKIVLLLSCIFLMTSFNDVYAKSSKHKKKAGHSKSHSKGKSKKSRRRRHHGNGPDLKEITKQSSYVENPDNGVKPIENGTK